MPYLINDSVGPSGRVYGKAGEFVTVKSEERDPLYKVVGKGELFFCNKDNLTDKPPVEVAAILEPVKDEPAAIIASPIESAKKNQQEISRLPFVMPVQKAKIKKVTKNDIPQQQNLF